MNVHFIKSATRRKEYPKLKLPQVAFVGRSNVGKSSVINSLVRRKGLARTSATPGRTQVINFFQVEDRWVFVDLPGYGFARVPERIRARWGPMVEEFLTRNERVKLTVMIVDVRHEPSELDQVMRDWLQSGRIPHLVVATKADKLSSDRLRKAIDRIKRVLNCEVIPYSAATGMGKKELWHAIERI